jgi:hypothetical protein
VKLNQQPIFFTSLHNFGKKKGTRAFWIRFSGQKGTAKGIKGTHPSKVLSQEVMKMDVQKVADD